MAVTRHLGTLRKLGFRRTQWFGDKPTEIPLPAYYVSRDHSHIVAKDELGRDWIRHGSPVDLKPHGFDEYRLVTHAVRVSIWK